MVQVPLRFNGIRHAGPGLHEAIASTRKDFVFLDASTGADGHCQVNARLRCRKPADGWTTSSAIVRRWRDHGVAALANQDL